MDSLKDLSDHLNFFVSCQGRSQLSPAIFRASRNHLVASKHSYMLQLSKSVINGQSVQVNMAYDLIYSSWFTKCLQFFFINFMFGKEYFFSFTVIRRKFFHVLTFLFASLLARSSRQIFSTLTSTHFVSFF